MAGGEQRRPDPGSPWGPTTRIGTGDAPAPPPPPRYAEQHPPPPSRPYAPPTSSEPYLPPTVAGRYPASGTGTTALPPAAPTPASATPTTETPPPREAPAPPTDELSLPKRFARKVRRGDQRDALRDAVSTVEARVPADFRIAIVTGVLAVAAAIVQQALFPVSSGVLTTKLVGYGLAGAFFVLGIIAIRSLASELARVSTAKGGKTAAQAIRVTTLLVGYLLVVLVTLGIIDVRLGNLLVGGALTGVVIGIAAQQALGNVFAGLVLLFSRPYVPGERIRVNSGAIGGPHDGVVVSVGLTYTVLLTSYGPLNLPNSQLLAAAIGPQPPDEDVADGTGDDGSQGTAPGTEPTPSARPASPADTENGPSGPIPPIRRA